MISSSSCCLAAYLNILGKTYLLVKYANINKEINLIKEIPKSVMLNPLIEVKIDNAKIAIMSCTNKVPIIILPCNVLSSLLSERSFITTIVEENAIINPIYAASKVKKPNSKEIK